MIEKITGSAIVVFFIVLWKLFVTNYFAYQRDMLLVNQFSKSVALSADFELYTVLGSQVTFEIAMLIGVVIILVIFKDDLKFAIESL